MALTNIEYGSIASSEIMNQNFSYLDNRISTLSSDLSANYATLNTNIATLNGSLSNINESNLENFSTINSTLNNMTQTLETGGLYISLYVNGTSWYKEYFSDSEKTQRVWLEQGFTTSDIYWNDNDQKTFNFLKSFTNTNYTVIAVSNLMYIANGVSSGNIAVESINTNSICIGNDAQNTFGVRVYACGQ